MRPLAALALAVTGAAAACAPASAVRPTPAEMARPSRTHVEVPLPGLTADQAVDRVRAAFAAEGLTIESASEGIVMSAPVRVRTRLSVEVDKRYIATVIDEERGARVVLRGESRVSGDERWSDMGSHEPSWPGRDGYHGFLKVRRIGARVAGEVPPDAE